MVFLANVITVELDTHLGKHKNLIFNIVRQMAPPTLGIFALYASLILLTSHSPIILRFHELNKILR